MRAPAPGRPRGAVRGAGVPRWGAAPAPPPPAAPAAADHPAPPDHQPPLYPYDEHINQRFAIWQGDITNLEVDVLTNTTDETMTECNAVSERVMSGAGPELKEEILTRGLECRAGEVAVTAGFSLRCRHVVHTACPSYSPQYHSAAETGLHNCYKNVLYAAGELNARSLALCVVDTPRRDFPRDLAAHTALRAVRRHLEQSRAPQLVILACARAGDAALLRHLAPRYFPRDRGEEGGAGGAAREGEGEGGAHPERRIRIIHNPHERAEDSAEDAAALWSESAAAEAAAALARACAPSPSPSPSPSPARGPPGPDDTQRLLAPDPPHPPQHPHLEHKLRRRRDDQLQYERLLRRAKAEDLSSVSGIGCLYQSGVDRLGRPVVVFIGKWFPIGDVDLDKALLYLIKLLDPIVRGDYVIAYFHTLAASGNHPPFSWLKEVYTVLPYKYKKNLKAFYIVHPTFWTKMMTWWFTTFMAPAIKAKVHNLPGVEFLYSVMARDQLEVPAFVTEHDMTINGLHYFQPDTNST